MAATAGGYNIDNYLIPIDGTLRLYNVAGSNMNVLGVSPDAINKIEVDGVTLTTNAQGAMTINLANANTWTAAQTFPIATFNNLLSNANTWTAIQTFSTGLVDVNPTYAYVANQGSANVSVINTSTNTVVTTISVGTSPISATVTPNGLYAYVTNQGNANVSVINTSTNTVVTTISVGTNPHAVAITPNGQYAYVANEGSANVSVINTATNTVVTTISAGATPWNVAITPNGLYAYVTNQGSGTVSVINTSTNTVVATITVGTYPENVAITPNGLYAYVTNNGSNNVSVINTSTNTVVATISVGTNPVGVAITPNGLYAYVANKGSNNVSVINTSTNTVVATISVGTNPVGVAITPNGLYAHVTNFGSANVSVINTTTNTVVATISVGANPYSVAVTPYFYTATQIAPYLSGFIPAPQATSGQYVYYNGTNWVNTNAVDGTTLKNTSGTLSINLANANTWTATQTFATIVPSLVNISSATTSVTGTTAGSIIWDMPLQGSGYKKVVVYLNGYENDTTTAQTITFPTAFTYAPNVYNPGAVPGVTASTTALSIDPDTTTVYTAWIFVEGF